MFTITEKRTKISFNFLYMGTMRLWLHLYRSVVQLERWSKAQNTLRWRHNDHDASQINSLTVVYSTVYSDADQRKHQSSASLAFVWGIHRDRWIPRPKGQWRGKCFHLMTSSWSEIFMAMLLVYSTSDLHPVKKVNCDLKMATILKILKY